MCKVFVCNPEKEAGFVLYNYLYSRESNDFTTEKLIAELREKKLVITKETIQKEINVMIADGIISQRVDHYVYYR